MFGCYKMFYTQSEIDAMTICDKLLFLVENIYYNVTETILVFIEGFYEKFNL